MGILNIALAMFIVAVLLIERAQGRAHLSLLLRSLQMSLKESLDSIKTKAAEEHVEVAAAFSRLEAGEATLTQKVADLQAQLAAGTPPSAEDLQEVQDIIADQQAVIDSAKGEAPAPPA